MKSNLKGLEVYQKEILVCKMKEDNLVEKPPMHSKSVVKTFYNKDIVSEWLLRSSK
jgi:hypothetical protein